ncbi:LysR substrate-binding domain-containing protein [Kocuria sp.]|uniref:LysR substrate-binding domain-containing protein n=1 Tax=Kocuria sp. TaxID=1871328 RepID=UPI0026DF3902|nr:LysR substrate-binding domain-containing protein [Kocuria sp.]MDO5617293.1 LysR substrate-binding domain-containing protein [Kocuria sp.]
MDQVADSPDRPEHSDVPDVPTLRVGYETGMMPAKWFDRWRDRIPGARLVETELTPTTWSEHIGGTQDVALIRLPAHPKPGSQDLAGLRGHYRAIPAYQELQVAVLPADHELTLLDELTIADLTDERLVHELTDLPEYRASPTGAGTDDDGAPLPPLEARSYEDVIEYVAAGIGLAVVPMSIARFFHRKDLTYRAVTDVPGIDVVVVWPQDLPEETEAMVQDLVGVVRGRKKDSSRGQATAVVAGEAPAERMESKSKPKQPKAKAGTTKLKPGATATRTAKGTSRGDQLKGKRLAGGKQRRGGKPGSKPGGKPGRPSTRGGGGRKRG